MKSIKLQLIMVALSFAIGVGVVALLPPSTIAGPDPCSSCYIYTECTGITTNCPYPTNQYRRYYSWYPDPWCEGPFDCSYTIVGCGICHV